MSEKSKVKSEKFRKAASLPIVLNKSRHSRHPAPITVHHSPFTVSSVKAHCNTVGRANAAGEHRKTKSEQSLFVDAHADGYMAEGHRHTAGPKRTQWEERQADENCFSSVAPHDDALCQSTASGPERRTGGFVGMMCLSGAKYRSEATSRASAAGPLPKRTQRQRRTGGFAHRPYLPEAR